MPVHSDTDETNGMKCCLYFRVCWHWKYISNSTLKCTQPSNIFHTLSFPSLTLRLIHPPQRLYQSFSFAKLVYHSQFPALHSHPHCVCVYLHAFTFIAHCEMFICCAVKEWRTIDSIFLITRGLFLPPIFIVYFIWRWVVFFSLSRLVLATALMLAINRL